MNTVVRPAPAPTAQQTSPPGEFIAHKRAERLAAVERAAPSKAGVFRRVYAGRASPRQAIKAQCLQCCAYSEPAIRDCTAPACPLWPFRPYRRGKGAP